MRIDKNQQKRAHKRQCYAKSDAKTTASDINVRTKNNLKHKTTTPCTWCTQIDKKQQKERAIDALAHKTNNNKQLYTLSRHYCAVNNACQTINNRMGFRQKATPLHTATTNLNKNKQLPTPNKQFFAKNDKNAKKKPPQGGSKFLKNYCVSISGEM